MTLILGVDPGLRGAFAFYDPHTHTLVQVDDMPTFSNDKNSKKTLNTPALAELLSPRLDLTTLAIIEEPHAMPKQGLSSTFAFGKACGIVIGIVATHKIPTIHANPSAWKAAMGLSHDKNLSRKKATDLFPKHAGLFSRSKDDGRAEAALLALFGWKFSTGQCLVGKRWDGNPLHE